MEGVPPVRATALFFDDIRLEAAGKLSLMGHYMTDMILSDAMLPVDRIAVLFHVRFPKDFIPSSVKMRMVIPGQPIVDQEVVLGELPDLSSKPDSAFSTFVVEFVGQARFPPLRQGDILDAWVIVNGHEFPAGRLYVVAPPTAPRTSAIIAS